MMRLFIWLLLIYIGYRAVRALTVRDRAQTGGPGRDTAEAAHQDPVCGIYVSEDDAVIGTLDGRRHYFCSMNCLEKFRERLNHTPP
jgi:YHS domain-containing protein